MTETERVVVKTYVPRYQKENWEREATDLDMSQSEFVRSMVQAGRNDIGLNGGSTASNPGSEALEQVVQGLLDGGARDWEEIRELTTDELKATLESMQTEGRIQYSPGEGYVLR